MNLLVWHVHGGYMTSLVQGAHTYLLPATATEGGRSGYDWPAAAVDVSPEELRDRDIDLVILQRPEELAEATRLLGREPGRDLPAVYLEHNTPQGGVPNSLHPLADQSAIPIVHVTHFNQLIWDSGRASSVVIEHGILDPGPLYTGELHALGVVINEPVRRWRVTGTDLLPAFAQLARVDVFGMGGAQLRQRFGARGPIVHAGDLAPDELQQALARRRAYLHPVRWTSLGLALLEAMHLGMPVLALATTEAIRAVPAEAGAISTDIDELLRAADLLLSDPDEARRRGAVAREVALQRYGLARFLDRWDEVLAAEVSSFHDRRTPRLNSAARGT
ncbi:MAG: glycosyltransferase [Propionibacteriaceae bacterium]